MGGRVMGGGVMGGGARGAAVGEAVPATPAAAGVGGAAGVDATASAGARRGNEGTSPATGFDRALEAAEAGVPTTPGTASSTAISREDAEPTEATPLETPDQLLSLLAQAMASQQSPAPGTAAAGSSLAPATPSACLAPPATEVASGAAGITGVAGTAVAAVALAHASAVPDPTTSPARDFAPLPKGHAQPGAPDLLSSLAAEGPGGALQPAGVGNSGSAMPLPFAATQDPANPAGGPAQVVLPPEAATTAAVSDPMALIQATTAASTTSITTPTAAGTAPPALAMPADPSAGFDDGLATHVTWMAAHGLGEARIRISPDHLGAIDLVLNIDGTRVAAEFQSTHADVRHALEAGLARLRDQLAQHGLQLVQAHVGDGRDPRQSPGRGDGQARTSHAAPADAPSATTTRPRMHQARLLDLYA